MSAQERRESVIRAAVVEFGRTGYHGTSTEAIARRVGVSQPYLFRLFPGKQALFRAAAERCFERIEAAFERAAEGLEGEAVLDATGKVYAELIRDRDVLLLQMQLYVVAASGEDPELTAFIQQRWVALWDLVRARAGATGAQMAHCFGHGMLINTLVSLGLPADHRCWDGQLDECKVAAAEPVVRAG